MDPFSLIGGAVSLVGMGISFGAAQKASEAQGQMYKTEGLMAQSEMKINDVKHQQMILAANRQQMQNLRNMQLARSMAVNSAVNQGAQFGTGLQGGLAQISGQGENQVLGLNQDVAQGNKMFGLEKQISYDKMGLSILGSQVADDQGKMAMGGALTQAGPTIGKLFGGLPGLFNFG